MTLNGVIALILRFSPNSIALQAHYVTVVEDVRKIAYCLSVPVLHFWPKLTHPAQRGLSAIAKHLVRNGLRKLPNSVK